MGAGDGDGGWFRGVQPAVSAIGAGSGVRRLTGTPFQSGGNGARAGHLQERQSTRLRCLLRKLNWRWLPVSAGQAR